MNIYRVLVNGENFSMTVDGKAEKLGFYTTRFVEAANEAEAETAAVSALRQDGQLRGTVLNTADAPPMLHVEEIKQVSVLEKAGETLEEIRENLQEALALILEGICILAEERQSTEAVC